MAAVETITTVLVAATAVAPAGPYDLIDLATVKDELDIAPDDSSQDGRLSRAISEESRAIAAYCNRVFVVETVQDLVYPERDAYPYQVPGGVAPLQLSRWPVAPVPNGDVTSVVIADPPGTTTNLVEGQDFVVDAAKGWLIRLNHYTGYPTSWDPVMTTIVYPAGYAAIPSDLSGAALRMITARWKARGRDPLLMSRDQPGALGNERYWVGGVPGVRGPFPQEIAAVLDLYRVPVTA